MSDLERIKAESRGLRGRLRAAFAEPTPDVDGESKQLLKFHGTYLQDDRDLRRREGKTWSFMVRSRIPGGRLSPAAWRTHDDLADRLGNGTLRLTTRQAIQLHGVAKHDVRETLRAIDSALLTTLGACGDVVRNVTCCPLSEVPELDETVQEIARRTLPATRAYRELWIDGGKVETPEGDPLYGEAMLPRKFKIGVALPGDDCVEVRTHDLGLVAVLDGGRLAGFNVWVGGGLGMTHKKPETFPRLADPLGFVERVRAVDLVLAVVAAYRELGDRSNRRHARLKYVVHELGVHRFREAVGFPVEPPRPLPPPRPRLHLGWTPLADGRWALGLPIENGRIRGAAKRGIREVVDRFEPELRITSRQDLILRGLESSRREEVERILSAHDVPTVETVSPVRRRAMACPALPTCGLALAEAERVLPAIVDELERELAGEALTVRMTGCPNGCARPYVADLAFVGRTRDRYAVLVGGSEGMRLNRLYADLVPTTELVRTVRPLLRRFRRERREGEGFGAFCDRVGIAGEAEEVRAHG